MHKPPRGIFLVYNLTFDEYCSGSDVYIFPGLPDRLHDHVRQAGAA